MSIHSTLSSGADQSAHATPLHCEDYTTPSQVMALVKEHIESLLLEETLSQKDTEAKQIYADHFLTELSKTTEDIPDHIYHQIRLKDPSQIVNSQGYSASKKLHRP
ncbi:hypothetical protein C0993_002504 [Termitomyces sp. T159_Od127]|nr:hypothetical protein C0993_002504 [Termitomyces sp. T159_Od127]